MEKETMVTIAKSAPVKAYASTVVIAFRARIVEGHQYASTIVSALGARNVEEVKYASTIVNAVCAQIVDEKNDAKKIVYVQRKRKKKTREKKDC